jgi:uncharacterized protein with ParB-like and HNH nuclease domain
MAENILTIEEYFKKGTFVIPNYQRGYKWGVPDKNGNCAVSVLIKNLIDAYNNKNPEYFIEAVTVVENTNDGEIHIIDGQQRTTTLYLLFFALSEIETLQKIVINYTVRKDSDSFLKSLKEPGVDISDKEEDIHKDYSFL